MNRAPKNIGGFLALAVFLVTAHSGTTFAGAVKLYDTVKPSALKKTVASFAEQANGGWTAAASGVAIKGDAVLMNKKIAAVIKRGNGGVAIYAKGADGWVQRTTIAPFGNSKTLAILEIKAGDSGSVTCGLDAKQQITFSLVGLSAILKASNAGNITGIRIAAPCRFGVLPDFFSDDLIVDAHEVNVDKTAIPTDNFFLHMVGNDDAIVAAVWDKNVKDAALTLSGTGADRQIVSTDVFFGKGGSIWTSVLEEKGIWHAVDISLEDAKTGKIIEDWVVPFMAKWKANFSMEDGTITSAMLTSTKGIYASGGMRYPAHNHGLAKHKTQKKKYTARLVAQQKTFPMVVEQAPISYKGPMIAYPIARFDTPMDQKCIDDLLRECLGMKACAYVLDVEAQQPQYRGIFTCSYGKTPGMFLQPSPVFDSHREMAETWKEDRAFMKRETKAVNVFITFIQDRTNTYVDLRQELLDQLKEAEKSHPDQMDFITRFRKMLNKPIPYYRTSVPASQRAIGEKVFKPWMDEMMKAMRTDTPQQAAKGMKASNAPGIGNKQDAILASYRRCVKGWRSMASMEMTKNPKASSIAKKIRDRTEKALRNPSNYERQDVWTGQ